MLKQILNKELSKKSTYLLFLIGISLYLLPLLLANVPYYDDNNRLLHGKAYWDVDGRPLTDFIMYLLNFNVGNIGNITPLPLILSIGVLSGALYFISLNMSYKRTLPVLLTLFVLVLNPFFLQNLSYQYDIIGMSLSISCVLLSYFNTIKTKKDYLLSVILLSASLAFYQPSSNVFLCLFFADILLKFKFKENIIKHLIISASIYLLGILCYYVTVFHLLGTATGRHDLIHMKDFIPSLQASWNVLENFLLQLFKSSFLFFAFIFVFAISLIWLVRFFEIVKSNNLTKEKVIESLILLTAPVFLFLSMWGPLLLLEELLFNPREFPGFGVILFTGLLALHKIDKRGAIYLVIITLFSIYNLSFVYQYGNSLSNQKKSDDIIFTGLTANINSLTEVSTLKPIYVYGETPRSLVTLKTIENNPFIGELEKPAFRWVGRAMLQAYGLPQVSRNVSFDDEKEWSHICSEQMKPLIKNRRYDIYEFEKHVSIWLLKEDKPLCELKPEKFVNIFSKNLK